MGITAKPFSHSIEGRIMELQRDFMVYVCNLSDMANPGAPPTQSTFKPRHDLQITIDESGYPFMPAAPSDDIIQTKTELAGLLRTYLNKHYCASLIYLFSLSSLRYLFGRFGICPAAQQCTVHADCWAMQQICR